MKTAISIPDDIFRAAEKSAQRLGLSRSGMYTKAISEFLQKQDDSSITEALNEVYSDTSSELDPVLAELQARSLPREEW